MEMHRLQGDDAPADQPAILNRSRPSTFLSISRRAMLIWAGAFLVALALDALIPHLVEPIARGVKKNNLSDLVKMQGHFAVTLTLAWFLAVLHPSRWRAAALLLLSGVFSGAFYSVAKWLAGRLRPVVKIDPYHFEPFYHGLNGFFHAGNMAFPSGHTCLAFSTAAAMAYLLPRAAWSFFGLACLVAVERVMELAHYPSDVVAGAIFGVLAFYLAKWLLGRLGAAPRPSLA